MTIIAIPLVIALAANVDGERRPRISAKPGVPMEVMEFTAKLASAVLGRDFVALGKLIDERGLVCGDSALARSLATAEMGKRGTPLNAFFFDGDWLRSNRPEVDIDGKPTPVQSMLEFLERSKEIFVETRPMVGAVDGEHLKNVIGVQLRSTNSTKMPVLWLVRAAGGPWRLWLNPTC